MRLNIKLLKHKYFSLPYIYYLEFNMTTLYRRDINIKTRFK